LSKKAAELDRKEQALRNAELGNGGKQPNWSFIWRIHFIFSVFLKLE
jgi:hypothetical protein